MLGLLGLDMVMSSTCSRFAWSVVKIKIPTLECTRGLICLGQAPYIRILGNASEKPLYPPNLHLTYGMRSADRFCFNFPLLRFSSQGLRYMLYFA
jgi:hypothetical protein